MSVKRWKFAIPAVLLIGTLASVLFVRERSAPEAPDPGAGFDLIRLPNNITDGAHLADEKGIFAKHRIRIEWTGKQAHGPASIISVLAGQNDAAGSISTAMLTARSTGAKLKIIASSGSSTKETPLVRYIVKDGSPITGKPSDFIGKKLVTNPSTISWYPIVMLVKRAGLDYKQVEVLSLPAPLAQEQALRQGEVDVISATGNQPPGSKLLQESGFHAIPGVSDFEVLGIDQTGGWVMREDFIAQHPDIVRRFIAGLSEAYEWANDHPAEAKDIINQRTNIPEAYRKYQGEWRHVPSSAIVDEGSIRKWIAILEEFGQIPRGSVRAEDVFTNALNLNIVQARAASEVPVKP